MKFRNIVFFSALFFAKNMAAQTPDDGLMMQKRQACLMLQGAQSQFSEYWEGTLKRDNPNLGTLQSRSLMLMGAYGITSKLNAMVGLPYIQNRGTASYITPERGVQDLSIWLKYQILNKKIGGGDLKLYATGGASTPMSGYNPENLPFSIGVQSSTVSLRGVAFYQLAQGFYGTLQAGHTWRSSVELMRDAFLFDGRMYNTNLAPVPNVLDWSGAVGYLRSRLQAEISYRSMNSLSGDDIRYNDMPFLTNRMNGTSVGAMVKYYVTKRLAFGVNGNTVLSGRNVGQSTVFGASVFYIIGKMDAPNQ